MYPVSTPRANIRALGVHGIAALHVPLGSVPGETGADQALAQRGLIRRSPADQPLLMASEMDFPKVVDVAFYGTVCGAPKVLCEPAPS